MNHSSLRPYIGSAALGGGYSLVLHLLFWVAFSVAYLSVPTGGNHLLILIVPAVLLLVGMIILLFYKNLALESWSFWIALLAAHILLSLLLLPLGNSLMEALNTAKALPPANSPDGDLSFMYLIFAWLLLGLVMGAVEFILGVAFLLRDYLRSRYGAPPKRPRRKVGQRARRKGMNPPEA